jgi:hypothetical protein
MRQRPASFAVAAPLLGLLFAGAPAAATSAPDAKPGQADLTYEIYTGGLHVLTFDLDLKIAPQFYDLTARYHSTGLLGWLIPWTSVSVSTGFVQSNKMVPQQYRVDSKLRGRVRLTDVVYDSGQVSNIKLVPPAAEDEDREEVTVDQRRDTLDPMSAILAATRKVDRGEGCGGTLSVFDGRRRYDLQLTDGGKEEVRAAYYSAFSGQAVRCEFAINPVAGYVRRPTDEETNRQLQSGRVWMAPIQAGGPSVPVRLELDGNWGMSIVHLKKFDWRPTDAQRVVEEERAPAPQK